MDFLTLGGGRLGLHRLWGPRGPGADAPGCTLSPRRPSPDGLRRTGRGSFSI